MKSDNNVITIEKRLIGILMLVISISTAIYYKREKLCKMER